MKCGGYDDFIECLTSKEMLRAMAFGEAKKLRNKEMWVEILMDYNIITVRDDLDEKRRKEIIPKDYVCVNSVLYKVSDLINMNLDKILDSNDQD